MAAHPACTARQSPDQRRRQIIEAASDPVINLRHMVESYMPVGEQTLRAWWVWAELWVSALHEPELQEVNDRIYGEWRPMMAGISPPPRLRALR